MSEEKFADFVRQYDTKTRFIVAMLEHAVVVKPSNLEHQFEAKYYNENSQEVFDWLYETKNPFDIYVKYLAAMHFICYILNRMAGLSAHLYSDFCMYGQKLMANFETKDIFIFTKLSETKLRIVHQPEKYQRNLVYPVQFFDWGPHRFVVICYTKNQQLDNIRFYLVRHRLHDGKKEIVTDTRNALVSHLKNNKKGRTEKTFHEILLDQKGITHMTGDIFNFLRWTDMPLLCFEHVIILGLAMPPSRKTLSKEPTPILFRNRKTKIDMGPFWHEFLTKGLYDPRLLVLIGAFAFNFPTNLIEYKEAIVSDFNPMTDLDSFLDYLDFSD